MDRKGKVSLAYLPFVYKSQYTLRGTPLASTASWSSCFVYLDANLVLKKRLYCGLSLHGNLDSIWSQPGNPPTEFTPHILYKPVIFERVSCPLIFISIFLCQALANPCK